MKEYKARGKDRKGQRVEEEEGGWDILGGVVKEGLCEEIMLDKRPE